MTSVIFRVGSHELLGVEENCVAPPPVNECRPREVCETEPRCCPPKTKVIDALRIYNNEHRRCINMIGGGCGEHLIPAINGCIWMDVRRRGRCEILCKVPATSLMVTGEVCFVWPPEFLNLPEGYYEGELMSTGKTKPCLVVGLYFPPCIGRPPASVVEYSSCTDADPTCLSADQSSAPVLEGCTAC